MTALAVRYLFRFLAWVIAAHLIVELGPIPLTPEPRVVVWQ